MTQQRESMDAQLRSLYAERERLFQALGTADAEEIIALVASLEEQLVSIYGERERAFAAAMGE